MFVLDSEEMKKYVESSGIKQKAISEEFENGKWPLMITTSRSYTNSGQVIKE